MIIIGTGAPKLQAPLQTPGAVHTVSFSKPSEARRQARSRPVQPVPARSAVTVAALGQLSVEQFGWTTGRRADEPGALERVEWP